MASFRLLEDGSLRLLESGSSDRLLEDSQPVTASVGTCYTSLQLCALRVAQLTTAGRPTVPGTNKGYATDAAIKLQIGVTLKTGADLEQQNGCGAVCAAFKSPDRIKRVDVALDLCQWDAQLVAMLTGGSVMSSGANAMGFKFPSTTGADPLPVCLEAWSRAYAGSQQASPSFTSPSPAYIHWVFPFVQFTPGAFTIENALMVIPVTGPGTPNAFITANGPYDDWPAVVAAAGGMTQVGGWFLDGALPAVACNYINTVSAAS